MFLRNLVLIILFLTRLNFFSQTHSNMQQKMYDYNNAHDAYSKKDSSSSSNKITRIQIGAGGIYSSLNFFKNAQVRTYYTGVTGRLYYQPLRYFRILVDYTQIEPVSI